MAGTLHPEFVDAFLKAAAEAMPKPLGMSGAAKATGRSVPKGPQVYSQPALPQQATRPDLVSAQKAVSPPPV